MVEFIEVRRLESGWRIVEQNNAKEGFEWYLNCYAGRRLLGGFFRIVPIVYGSKRKATQDGKKIFGRNSAVVLA